MAKSQDTPKRIIPAGMPVYYRGNGPAVWVSDAGWIPLAECEIDTTTPSPSVRSAAPVFVLSSGELAIKRAAGMIPLSQCHFPEVAAGECGNDDAG